MGFLRIAQHFIRRQLKNSGHGGDRLANFLPGANEKRQYQLFGAQSGFLHEPAQRRRFPQTSRTVIWKLPDKIQTHAGNLMKPAECGNGDCEATRLPLPPFNCARKI
jgi:hypothetical protein